MTDPNPRLPRLFSNSCNIPYFSGCALTAKEKFVLVHLMPVLMPQAPNSRSRDTERTGDNSTDQPRLPPLSAPRLTRVFSSSSRPGFHFKISSSYVLGVSSACTVPLGSRFGPRHILYVASKPDNPPPLFSRSKSPLTPPIH